MISRCVWLVISKRKSGPRQEPWNTPQLISFSLETWWFIINVLAESKFQLRQAKQENPIWLRAYVIGDFEKEEWTKKRTLKHSTINILLFKSMTIFH